MIAGLRVNPSPRALLYSSPVSSSPRLALFHHLSLAQLRRPFLRFSRAASRVHLSSFLRALIYPWTSISPPPNLPPSPAFPHFAASASKSLGIARDSSTFIACLSLFRIYVYVCVCVCVFQFAFPYFLRRYLCNCLPGNIVQFSLPNGSLPCPFFRADLCFRRASYPRIPVLRWYPSVSCC